MTKSQRIEQGIAHLLSADELQQFTASLNETSPVSVRMHPQKFNAFPSDDQVPWCKYGRYLPLRPVFTLDPLFHAGSYYVQEASSMFVHHMLEQWLPDKPLRILDLCAAPGGKTTSMASFLKDGDLLVANEMIRNRCSVLRENVFKYGHPGVLVTNNEPRHFTAIEGFFDVILVDAPCSGEGMIRKDPEALKEWSPENVNHCSVRQHEILQQIWPALKPGGLLLYSTCTYNAMENEQQVEAFAKENAAENPVIPISDDWNIITTKANNITCYRFFPHKIRGEGFFIAGLIKPGNDNGEKHLRKEKVSSTKKATELYAWLKEACRPYLFMEGNAAFIHRFPKETEYLKKHLRFALEKYPIGERKGKDWIPAPEFALSLCIEPENFQKLELEIEDALRFLKTEEIKKQGNPGWNLICYQNLPLGWIKQLANRSNNYFPKEWKIRMDLPG